MGIFTIICGMDRSGTSLCAAVSQIVGIHLGDNLIGPREANPKGYFEDRRGVSINKELLRSHNYARKLAVPLPSGWQGSIAAKLAEMRIRRVLGDLSKGQEVFGVKDPRLCLTSEIWARTAKNADHEPRYVICVRHPLEVAESLHKRDGTDKAAACLMWISHTMSVLKSSKSSARIWITYQDLMSQPLEVAATIKDFTGQGRDLSDKEIEKIHDFVDESLWHNKAEKTPQDYSAKVALEFYELVKENRQEELDVFMRIGPGMLIDKLNNQAALSLSRWIPSPYNPATGEG